MAILPDSSKGETANRQGASPFGEHALKMQAFRRAHPRDWRSWYTPGEPVAENLWGLAPMGEIGLTRLSPN